VLLCYITTIARLFYYIIIALLNLSLLVRHFPYFHFSFVRMIEGLSCYSLELISEQTPSPRFFSKYYISQVFVFKSKYWSNGGRIQNYRLAPAQWFCKSQESGCFQFHGYSGWIETLRCGNRLFREMFKTIDGLWSKFTTRRMIAFSMKLSTWQKKIVGYFRDVTRRI